jgi:hypothetical protein
VLFIVFNSKKRRSIESIVGIPVTDEVERMTDFLQENITSVKQSVMART